MAKTDGKDYKGWISLVVVIIAAVGGACWTLAHEFSTIDKHLARVEMAVRIIGAKQGGDTKTLIDEALAVAKNASEQGRTASAATVMGIANRLLAEEQDYKTPVPQEFFDATLKKYKQLGKSPALGQSAWQGITRLAEYRSATSVSTAGISEVRIGEISKRGNFQLMKDSVVSGQNAISTSGCAGFQLDGWYLENVTFQNVKICYRGGPAVLSNVHFVNCQFDVASSPRTQELMEAVIRETTSITIG